MTVVISGNDLTIDDVVRVARERAPVRVAPEAAERVGRSRVVVERLVREQAVVYGVTTGLGALKGYHVADDDIGRFQRNILMSHAVGTGAPYDSAVVRAMMVTRLNGMARGGSGVQPAVFELLLDVLNAGIHPLVPSRGSIGVGDLAPLAHMALPLIGLGEAEFGGQLMPGLEALQQAGLRPVELGAKDALALCSANSASVGHGALVIADSYRLMTIADIAAALSLEGFQGNVGPLDARAHVARPFPGQRASAAKLRALLAGSGLWTLDHGQRLQDPLSFRCVTQVHGASRDALAFAARTVEVELNSSSDNPLVLPDEDTFVPNGNFHVAGLSMGFDLLAIALAQLTSLATGRVIRLMDPALSGLPPQLTPNPGPNCGFGVLQKTVTALGAEVRYMASPASLNFTPVADDIEDHATMTTMCVSKAAQILDSVWRVLAIELLTAAQAVDLRGDITLGAGAQAAYGAVRSVAAFSAEDRVLAADVDAVYRLLVSGRLLGAVNAAVTEQESVLAPSFVYQI
jgi:histidine ammonia-lyase